MYAKIIIKYFVLSFTFLAFAFSLHRITGYLILPKLTHRESLLIVALIFSGLSTAILIQIKIKQELLEQEKDSVFKTLRETEREFKALFDDALSGNFLINSEGIFIDVNPAFLTIFGYDTKAELIGTDIRNLHPDTSEYNLLLNELKIKGRLINYHTKLKKKNGNLIYVSENIIASFDSFGEIVKIKVYLFDITGQITSEKLLLKNELKHTKVLNSIRSAFYFYSLSGDDLIFTGSNPAANKIISIQHEDLVGKTIEECFSSLPSHIIPLYKNIAKGLQDDQSFEIEYSETRFSGIYQVDVFRIDSNKIAVNFIDITEKKKEENSQLFLKNILDILNKKAEWSLSIKNILSELKRFSKFDAVGIRFEHNNDFPYYVQAGFSEEFQRSEDSICSRCIDGLVQLGDDGKPILECSCGLLLTREPDLTKDYYTPGGSIWTNNLADFLSISKEAEQRINPRNKCIHHGYMSVLLTPLKIDNKKVGLLQMNHKESGKFTLSDISFYEEIGNIIGIAYEKVLANQLQLIQENQLKQLNKTKDKLFSIIGHDLRNTIGHVVNYSELLKQSCAGLNEKSTGYIETISYSAESTLTLLEDLLLWAKSQTGQLEFKPELLSVDSIFTEIHEMLNPAAIIKDITVKNSCMTGLKCFADKQMFKCILRNLLQNAIKFTNSGGLIEMDATVKNDKIEFSIRDNGIGMNSAYKNRLFKTGEIIYAETSSGNGSSGLGLILCNEFVKKHNGEIAVESEPGNGSKFHFKLPII